MVIEILQRMVSLDQRDGCLLPDPFDSGNIIAWIPHQAHNLDHPARLDAEFFLDPVDGDPFVLGRVEQAHSFTHKLHQVLVSGDDHDPDALSGKKTGQSGDEIIGLISLELPNGDIHGLKHLADVGKLGNEIGRGLRAIALVFLVEVVTKRHAAGIQKNRQINRLIPLEKLECHSRKAVDSGGWQPRGIAKGRKGKKGAEDIGAAVDEINTRTFRHWYWFSLTGLA